MASGKVLAEPDQIAFGALQQRLSAPIDERLLAEIAPIQFEQIEALDAHGHVSAIEQGEEVGFAPLACGDQFAVDDAGLRRDV